MLALMFWMAAGALVSPAAAETVDAPGVTIGLNGSALLHRTAVPYPNAARQRGVQGAVAVEVTLDGAGSVADAHVISGPPELRRAVLESVLQWHFAHEAANGTRLVTVQFQLPAAENLRPPGPDFRPAVVVSAPAPLGPLGRTIKSIDILGLPPEARTELLARLPVHAGEVLSAELAEGTGRAVREFDEHLNMGLMVTPAGEAVIQIVAPGYTESLPQPTTTLPKPYPPSRIRVSGDVQQSKLKSTVPPVYPPVAKQARIQGIVKLNATLGKDGTVQNLMVISGHPLLVPAALDAVKQWAYEPTNLNGTPAEVETEIEVSFSLAP
jgi:TonB family protein